MRYFLGLGTNLGDRNENLLRAVDALKKARVKVLGASSVYQTQPVGGPAQPWFYNQVIEVETGLSPAKLLALAKRIERDLGRRPARRPGPRTMDIDILLAGDRVISRERLIIPHPRMAGRNFVLVPLREIAPRAVHPVLGVEIEELSAKSGDKSIVRRVRAGLSGKRPGKTKTGRLARQRGEHS